MDQTTTECAKCNSIILKMSLMSKCNDILFYFKLKYSLLAIRMNIRKRLENILL